MAGTFASAGHVSYFIAIPYPLDSRASGSWLITGIFAGSSYMKERQLIALYGNSLFLAGLETSLKKTPQFDVVRIDANLLNADCHLESLYPSVVIFDHADVHLTIWPDMTQLFRENPGVIAIGFDLTSSNVTILSGKSHAAPSVEDLVEAILMATGHSVDSASTASSDAAERKKPSNNGKS